MEQLRKQIMDILDKYIFDKKIWDNVPENFSLINDLKINSARIVDIVIDIEETFNIEINNEELQKILTIDDIISLIDEKTKN